MESDSGGATAAVHGCRSEVGADRAPAGDWSSSKAGVSLVRATAPAFVIERASGLHHRRIAGDDRTPEADRGACRPRSTLLIPRSSRRPIAAECRPGRCRHGCRWRPKVAAVDSAAARVARLTRATGAKSAAIWTAELPAPTTGHPAAGKRVRRSVLRAVQHRAGELLGPASGGQCGAPGAAGGGDGRPCVATAVASAVRTRARSRVGGGRPPTRTA
jgi:hypothetical protein